MISQSPADVQPVFDAIAEQRGAAAARPTDGSHLARREGDLLRAGRGTARLAGCRDFDEARHPIRRATARVVGRAVLDRRTVAHRRR